MIRIFLAALVILFGLASATPAHAWRGHGWGGWGWGPGLAVGFGVGACCGYYPYYSPYYSYPAYYAPPPTVVYQTAPAPVTYVVPQAVSSPVAAAAQPVAATPTSDNFTDSIGRTCRHFQSAIDGAPVNGTACLQQDGSWHTVEE